MNKLIAVIDSSPTAPGVLRAAAQIAPLFDAAVEAIHVREDGGQMPRAVADAARVPIRILAGSVTEVVLKATLSPDVRALVLGARRGGGAGWDRPAGHTALELIRRSTIPAVVVPADLAPNYALNRVLVPLATSVPGGTLDGILRSVCGRGLRATVLHVIDEGSIPRFSDQKQYEGQDRADEFRKRFCPDNAEVAVHLRMGAPPEEILNGAREFPADLIVLEWAQELTHTAAVVRAVLRRSEVPVLLVPRPGAREEPHAVSRTVRTGERA